MKLSELQLGQSATIKHATSDYTWSGKVEKTNDGRLWLTKNHFGYLISSVFDDLWQVVFVD